MARRWQPLALPTYSPFSVSFSMSRCTNFTHHTPHTNHIHTHTVLRKPVAHDLTEHAIITTKQINFRREKGDETRVPGPPET